MKKKIAAFANGWSDEYLLVAIEGVRKCAIEYDYDVYFFIDYSSSDRNDTNIQGEVNILNLANLDDYAGVLLMGNTLTNAGELDILKERILKKGIPAVCLEYEIDGIDCICTDNYSGMAELCEHLITEHNVKRVAFVSGMADNQENKERLHAVKDTLKKHGLSLDDEDIIYGEWSYYTIQARLPEWRKNHDLPDAFICANDVMAMGAITALSKENVNMPEDVIVTGFDNVASSETAVPALTTVDRQWTQRSYDGMKHLVDLINGGERKGKISYPSTCLHRESCGCTAGEETKKKQMHSINKVYTVPIERTLFDWHLTGLDEAATSGNTLASIHDGLADFFSNGSTSYEGDTFCICLDETFVDSIYNETEPKYLGYSEQVQVLYAKRDGKTMPLQKIKTSYIFPVFSNPDEPANIYLIAPLHSFSANIGYCVFKNHIQVLDTYFLYSWLRHLRSSLMRSRQNIIMENMNQKLNEISVMDELSGLYNRKGYEKRGIPMLEEIKKHVKHALMMVVDINKMKMINDRYGHLQGDLAIRLVAKAIRENMPEGWYGIRYGGDEFVVIGEKVFVDDGTILKRQICNAVEGEAKTMRLPFKLTVSVGSVLMDPKENISLDEYFRMADDAMYEMKKRTHASEEYGAEEKNT